MATRTPRILVKTNTADGVFGRHATQRTSTVKQPKSPRRHHLGRNLVSPQTTLSTFTNKATYASSSYGLY